MKKILLAVTVVLGLWHFAVLAQQPTEVSPTVSHVDLSTGMKSTLAALHKDSVVVIIDPAGKLLFSNSEGLLLTAPLISSATEAPCCIKCWDQPLQDGTVVKACYKNPCRVCN